MMRKKIVAGNWKMNSTLEEARHLLKAISSSPSNPDVLKIICPPFVYLSEAVSSLSPRPDIKVGAQNCSQHVKGAFTGEISPLMLHACGCEYVILGHSERRVLFMETDLLIQSKLLNALNHALKVIFCYGETLEERERGEAKTVIAAQLTNVLKALTKEQMLHVVLAYEPVWAIGTGLTASPLQAQEMHSFSREIISDLFDASTSNSTSILYGGSCNAGNASQIFACKDVDGGLIGGASLNPDDFNKIINSFRQ